MVSFLVSLCMFLWSPPDSWAVLKGLSLWLGQWSWTNPCGVRIYGKRFSRTWNSPCCFLHPGSKGTDDTGQSGSWFSSPDTNLSNSPVGTADGVQRKSSCQSTRVGWHCQGCWIDLEIQFMSVTACPPCSKQCPRQLQKEPGTLHQNSQPARVWHTDYIAPSCWGF